MCHEIRTPLNSIVGFSEIILDEDCDDESKAEFRELIKTNAGVLTSLVDDMLVVANLDSSRELLPCEVVNVSDICREEFGKFEQRNRKPVKYVLNVPEEEVVCSTNAKHLSIVLENLLSNACKFTEEGCITLELLKSDSPDGIRIEKREEYEKDRQMVTEAGLEDHYTCTDIDTMEEIARQVPLSRIDRPRWDQKILQKLGTVQVSVDTEVWNQVWSEVEKVNYHSTPMFGIEAVKE